MIQLIQLHRKPLTCFPYFLIYALLLLQTCILSTSLWIYSFLIVQPITLDTTWWIAIFFVEFYSIQIVCECQFDETKHILVLQQTSKQHILKTSSSHICRCRTFTYLIRLRNDSIRIVDMKLQKPHIWSCPPHTRVLSMCTLIENAFSNSFAVQRIRYYGECGKWYTQALLFARNDKKIF